MQKYLIRNATIINEADEFIGSIIIENGKIKQILRGKNNELNFPNYQLIDAEGQFLFPGIIDVHTHFREPGLTQKADIYSESKAAVAGGVTSYFEMPNTTPQATNISLLEEKYEIASQKSFANYSFFLGATNNNYDELEKLNPKTNCGIKLFLGASTGDMLVDREETIKKIFKNIRLPIVVHSEDTKIILQNTKQYKELYGNNIPIKFHGKIRSTEACYKTTKYAVDLAKKHGTKLHIAHLTTAKELELLENNTNLKDKKITAEVCPQHLYFDENDYEKLGTKIKCNPSIKTEKDKNALFKALINNYIDLISTDHAPHLLDEKNNIYTKAPSGIPMIQFSLVAMLELYNKNKISLQQIAEKMCHAPATVFNIEKRGFIKEGYWADIVLINPNEKWLLTQNEIISKCKWSPFENKEFNYKISHTFVNGNLIYENENFNQTKKGKRISFTNPA